MAPKLILLALLAILQPITAHFRLLYPPWRADTLSEQGQRLYSQYTFPCAGVNVSDNPTPWPLQGGSLRLSLHHTWSYLFINLGLGEDARSFNISLTRTLWNVTGRGSLCIEELRLPEPVADGALGTLQVVTTDASGDALYNCADVRFSKDAGRLSNCTTDEGVSVRFITEQNDDDGEGGNGADAGARGGNSSGGHGHGGATSIAACFMSPDRLAVASVLGMAVVFAFGLGV